MADCEPLIDSDFLTLITGATFDDQDIVDQLIVVVSTLIGEEYGACVVPADASMKLRVVCAKFVSYVMGSGSGVSEGNSLRAEQIGDYRVEYQQQDVDDRMDLDILRAMLASMVKNGQTTLDTLDDKTDESDEWAAWTEANDALWVIITGESS